MKAECRCGEPYEKRGRRGQCKKCAAIEKKVAKKQEGHREVFMDTDKGSTVL